MQPLPAQPLPSNRSAVAVWPLALKVAGIYGLLASGWIVVSDLVLADRTGVPREILWVSMGKGLGFVFVTAGLLTLLVRHYLRLLQKIESRQRAEDLEFRSLVEQSNVGVYLIQDDRFVYVNPCLAGIFGYTPQKITEELTVADLVLAGDHGLVREKIAGLQRDRGKGANYSFRGQHHYGWPLQLEAFGRGIEHLGRPAVLGTLLDTTDWHEAEAALRESEERGRQLIQTAPDAIVVMDVTQGRFVEYNPEAEKLFELTGGELRGYGLIDLSPEKQPDGRSSAPALEGCLTEAIAGGTPTFEWLFRSRTGREIPCEVRLVQLPAHGRTLIRGSIVDITERRRTARALARSEANYRQLFDHATDGIFLCDAAGRIVDVNRATVGFTGYSREELLQRDAFAIIAREDHDSLRHCLKELQLQGTRFGTYRFRGKDGTIRFGETNTKLLPDGRLLAMVRDITERRLIEAQRQKLEEELQQAQKLQAIGTLAGGIAHDFNNILAAILGNAQLLKLQLSDGHEGQGKVAQIVAASNRAKDLVQQILMFSRQRQEDRRVLDLTPIAVEALKLIEVNLPATVALELAAPPGLPAVLADATQMHQIIVNLCTNAVHAMRENGGALRVGLSVVSLTERSSLAKLKLAPGRYVCLQVQDTGHGMDEATMERIYEPFFTTKSVGEGTGLGLAVVHGIVQSHGGGIAITSRPGKGTTFKVYLPAEAVAAPSVEAKPPAILPPELNQNILFVDDEEPIAEIASLMLPRLGHRVVVFTKPHEALAYLRKNPAAVDLLMTDLSMPEMNGIDLIRAAIEIKPDLPSVLLTGYGNAIESKSAIGLNIHETIIKPFTMEKLAHAIQGALVTKH